MVIIRSIQAKVVAVIILVLSVSVAGLIVITISNQRSAFLDETSRNLAATSAIVNNVIRNTMVVGEAPVAIRTIQDIQGIGDFETIAIYRRDGTTAFRDTETIDDVNARISPRRFEVTARVPLATTEDAAFDRVIRTNTPVLVESVDARRVDYYFPILNYAECRICHGTDEFIRGVAHFRVSTERVFAEISNTQSFLTLFFVATGIVLGAVIVLLMRGMVLEPLFSLRATVSAVGGGNLDVTANIRSHDEFGDLADSINTMIVGLKDRERLEIQNQVIEARNDENRKYLDNINEGLLLLDSNQIISDQYSTFLVELFGTEKIAGRKFSEFLYPADEASERRRDLDQFIDLVFTSVTTDMEMIASINPLADVHLIVGNDNREIVLDVTFQRIIDGDVVQNVMAIFVDKTQLVEAAEALRRERERNASEQEQIAAILRTGPEAFIQFTRDARTTLRLLDEHSGLDGGSEVLRMLFRELHSLKGAARYMELRGFARMLNDLEEIVATVRDGKRTADATLANETRQVIDGLSEGIADIDRISRRFREFASHDESQRAAAGVRGFFDNLERMVTTLASDMGKTVRLRSRTEFDHLPMLDRLRNPIIHLVRNAIDHGIEEALERISKGKPETGTVSIVIAREADKSCRIEVRDDGRGIDFAEIARHASRLGLVTDDDPSQNRLLKAMFHPRFTSRGEATEVSGRGVGLDAVQDIVHTLRGSIAVATRADVGSRFTIRVPLDGGET